MPDLITRDNLPLQSRSFKVVNVNVEERTVDLVATTEYPVQRWDWDAWRLFNEVLAIESSAINMERMNNNAPLLDSHQSWNLKDQLGVVVKGWIEGSELKATVRFSKREDVEPIFQDVVDGIICNVSIGYTVQKYLIEEHEEGQTPTYRATSWTPHEVSLVPIPADPNAGIRSSTRPNDLPHSNIIYQERAKTMPQDENLEVPATQETTTTATATPTEPVVTQSVDTEAVRQQAVQAENQRIQSIRALCGTHGLARDFEDSLVQPEITIDKARSMILDHLAERSGQIHAQPRGDSIDQRVEVRQAIEESILARSFSLDNVSEQARGYRGMTLVDLARDSIERAGGNTRGMSQSQIVQLALSGRTERGMHTTSDFPIALANVGNRAIEQGYTGAGQTFWPLVKRKTAPNFKEMQSVRFGNGIKLELLPESGQYKPATINDAVQRGFKLDTYGRLLTVSRQAIINDDIGIFDQVFKGFGKSSANLESDMVWALIIGNAKTPDGKPLFDASHNNMGTGPITIENIDLLDQLIGKQTDPNTKDFISLYGEYLIVPRAQLLAVRKLLGFYTPTKADDVNPLPTYSIISDPRLKDSKEWMLAAGPNQAPGIELLYLEGEEGIQTETQEGFDVDGVSIKARLDFACTVADYRFIAKSSGE